MTKYKFTKIPPRGEGIVLSNGVLSVPEHPIIPYVEGDGTGPDIWRASVQVFDAAVERAYEGERHVAWMYSRARNPSSNSRIGFPRRPSMQWPSFASR
jgi:isocitrate dehydrogenase